MYIYIYMDETSIALDQELGENHEHWPTWGIRARPIRARPIRARAARRIQGPGP